MQLVGMFVEKNENLRRLPEVGFPQELHPGSVDLAAIAFVPDKGILRKAARTRASVRWDNIRRTFVNAGVLADKWPKQGVANQVR